MSIIRRNPEHVAIVREGRVVALGSVPLNQPLPEGYYRVPEDHVQIGYLVDSKGNFTPSEGRTRPLAEGEYAGHAGPAAYTTAAERRRAPINHPVSLATTGAEKIEAAETGELPSEEPATEEPATEEPATEELPSEEPATDETSAEHQA